MLELVIAYIIVEQVTMVEAVKKNSGLTHLALGKNNISDAAVYEQVKTDSILPRCNLIAVMPGLAVLDTLVRGDRSVHRRLGSFD
jgi:hypothetical protein